MSNTATLSEAVEFAVSFADSARTRLLHTLEHIPDDKLDWSPAPGAKSAIRIAAHAALSSGNFVSLLRGDPMPDMPFEEMLAGMVAAEVAVKTRAQVIELINTNCDSAIAALKAITPARMAEEVQTPFRPMPVPFIMTLVGRHMDSHAAQIDYIQTLWGDSEMHF